MNAASVRRDDVPFGWVVGGKWYGRCANCGGVVRINKPIIGGLHFCGGVFGGSQQ